MAESSTWNNRSTTQRGGFVSSMAYGRAYDRGSLPMHSKSDQINEKALVIDIHRGYGRILSPTNVRRPNLHIFFSLRTLNGSEPLSAITDDLSELFVVGDQVEIGVERIKVVNGAASECQVIIECSNILQIRDELEHPELAPLLMVQEGGGMPLAVTKRCGLVGVHPQVLPDQTVINAFLENKVQVSFPQMEWPEFAMIGHSVEGRVIRAPRWFNQALSGTQEIEKVALTLQRFGRDVAGFAIVKGHLENGVILLPIDKDDLKECGEIFFPFEIKRAESDFDYRTIYRIGSKWYFRACPELPGRRFRYRAYSLDDLNGTMPRHSEPLSAQTMAESGNDRARQNAINANNGTRCCQLATDNDSMWEDSSNNNSYGMVRLVDIDASETDIIQPSSASLNQSQQAPPKPIVSESTLNLLSEVDFAAPSNLLDISEPYLSTEPLVPIRPSQMPSFASNSFCTRAQSTNIDNNKNGVNTMNNNPFTTSDSQQNVDTTQPESTATLHPESFASLSSFCPTQTISTESYSQPHLPSSSNIQQQQQPSCAHDTFNLSDGETKLLISTPPPSIIINSVNNMNKIQNDKNINVYMNSNNAEQRCDIVESAQSNSTKTTPSSTANEFDNTLTSNSLPRMEICRKYDVFDEATASEMHFEVISKPKQTLEEELIGGFEDEHEHYFDSFEVIQSGSAIPPNNKTTAPTIKNAPNGKSDADIVVHPPKTSPKAMDCDKSKSTSTTEASQGDVQFVKTNESLAEALYRLGSAAGDHPQNSPQPCLSKSSEQIEGDSSDSDVDDESDVVRCNTERPLYAIRVPRRANDDEFWFTSKNNRQSLTCEQSFTKSHSQSSVVSSNDGTCGEIAENTDKHGHKLKNQISDPIVNNNSTEDVVDASKIDRETQYDNVSQEQTALPSLAAVVNSDTIFAKFFTGVVKKKPE